MAGTRCAVSVYYVINRKYVRHIRIRDIAIFAPCKVSATSASKSNAAITVHY